MTQLVVKNHRPWQMFLLIVSVNMILALITWLALDSSHWSVISERISSSNKQKLLWETNQSLEQENVELREQVQTLSRITSVDKQTLELLQEDLKNQQSGIFRLKRELEFYQGIMDDVRYAEGLNVHGVHIEPVTRKNTYKLKVILTHVTKRDRLAEGKINIRFEGLMNNEIHDLSLQQVSLDNAENNAVFKFRNFNRFENSFELPDGFSPQRIFVELTPKGRKKATLINSFEWPVVAERG